MSQPYTRILGHGAAIVVLWALLGAGVGLVVSLLDDEEYSATAWLSFESSAAGGDGSGADEAEAAEAETRERFGSLAGVGERAAETLDGASPEVVAEQVEISAGEASDLVTVTATDPDRDFASSLANAVADSYVAVWRADERTELNTATQQLENALEDLDESELAGAPGRRLERELRELETDGAVPSLEPVVAERAEAPESASSSRHVGRNTLIGAAGGGLVGLALLLLVHGPQRRLRGVGALARALSLPVLAVIPASRRIGDGGGDTDFGSLPREVAEPFGTLSVQVRNQPAFADLRSVLVTSRVPGEGSTTVAWQLARTVAATGSPAFLLEANLRDPALGRERDLGLAPVPGLSEVLTAEIAFERAVQSVALDADSDQGARLDVLTAGHVPPNAAELLAGRPIARLVEEISNAYDLLVIDAPPVGTSGDAVSLLTAVDGVLVVAATGRTTRDEAEVFSGQLRRLAAPLLGVVVNRTRSAPLRRR